MTTTSCPSRSPHPQHQTRNQRAAEGPGKIPPDCHPSAAAESEPLCHAVTRTAWFQRLSPIPSSWAKSQLRLHYHGAHWAGASRGFSSRFVRQSGSGPGARWRRRLSDRRARARRSQKRFFHTLFHRPQYFRCAPPSPSAIPFHSRRFHNVGAIPAVVPPLPRPRGASGYQPRSGPGA